MPIFEYQCGNCHQRTEKIQRKPVNEICCPGCGKKAPRTVSLTSFTGPESGGCSRPAGSGFT